MVARHQKCVLFIMYTFFLFNRNNLDTALSLYRVKSVEENTEISRKSFSTCTNTALTCASTR